MHSKAGSKMEAETEKVPGGKYSTTQNSKHKDSGRRTGDLSKASRTVEGFQSKQ